MLIECRMVSRLAAARHSRAVLQTALAASMLVAQAAAFAPSLPTVLSRPGLLAARRATGLQMQLGARGTAPRFSPRLVVPWAVRTFRTGKTAASMAETGEAVGDKVHPRRRHPLRRSLGQGHLAWILHQHNRRRVF